MSARLSDILSKLIGLSTADQQPHTFVLKHGLVLMTHVQPTKFTLRIARTGQEPAYTEWKTVVAALPESYKPSTPVIPAMYQERQSLILSASWQLPERLL